MCGTVYSGCIHNHQKMEKNPNALQMVNGYAVIYPYDGILLNNKKECTTNTQNNMHEYQIHYAKWKKPHSKTIQCMIAFI